MANKNYDPKKAHEYYEKTKKLKGRNKSTKGFNKNQNKMFAYVKNDLQQREKAEISAVSLASQKRKTAISERAKSARQAFTEACKEKVEALREKLKSMSKDEKIAMKARINSQIAAIQEQFADAKANVTANAMRDSKIESANLKATKNDISAKYDKKLNQAHSAIKSNKKVLK